MKRLQEDTMSKMAVLGRGSMRNKQQVSHKVHASTQNKLKVSLILNAHLDYSYHYARSFFFLNFPPICFNDMLLRQIKQPLKKL